DFETNGPHVPTPRLELPVEIYFPENRTRIGSGPPIGFRGEGCSVSTCLTPTTFCQAL
ncbi:unnamed protein product, partial [Rotaria magnacalcarata]